jgi:rhodanese-related sulfurtransferase
MSKTYIVITIVAVLGAAILVLLPQRESDNEIKPEYLFNEIKDQSRFLSVDFVAQRLIEKDPSIVLVDVRKTEQYREYALPGAINIPLDSILLPDNEPLLNRNDVNVILYSNSDIFSDQAWILCTRMGYKNLFIMKGGLNTWFDIIMQPVEPPATAASEEFDLYTFRLAASQYFGGGNNTIPTSSSVQENIKIIKREKKSGTAGGC